jgi:hypothetical protein
VILVIGIRLREYILTEKEREIVQLYLKEGTKLYGFFQLINRAKKNYSRLEEDMKLIRTLLNEQKKCRHKT